MKTINKSARRVLSLCIAVALLIGSLFTATVGFNVTVNAATDATGEVYDVWNNTDSVTSDWYDTVLAGSGTEDDPFLITSCEELVAVCVGKVTTAGLYFKVEGIDAFYMDSEANVARHRSITSAAETQEFYEYGTSHARIWWSSGTFEGNIDFCGATVYGVYTPAGYQAAFGLFPYIKNCTIKNLNVKNFYSSTNDDDKGSSFSGAIFGGGSWGGEYTANIENCTVENCYIVSTGTYAGVIGGHAANVTVNISNCFTENNYTIDAWNRTRYVIGYGDKGSSVTDCVFIGNQYECSTATACTYTDVYTTATQNTALTGVTTLTADAMKGVSAKINMTGLNWATDTTDGEWYAVAGDYPATQKPDGWVDLIIPDVWDGSAATEFAGGSGTKDDPYIIKTAAQLRKMVLDGGRIDTGKTKTVDNNGTKVQVKVYEKAYYKVADGVTDIYLNPVVEGTLETIKTLASNGTALNWTSGLFDDATFKADADGDGMRDQATAFRGEFDGNGATIHGLYSKTVDRSWNNEGVGFVPALMDDAVIKNVTFDKAYVHNTGYTYAGVITASLGYDSVSVTNTDLDPSGSGGQTINGGTSAVTSVGIHNVTVSNSRVQTSSTSGYGGVAGFVASHGTPVAVSFTNCLFDDSNELVVPDGFSASGGGTGTAGFVNLGQSGTQHFYFENCVSLGAYPDNQANDHPVYTDCYTTETSSKSGLTGGITAYSTTTMPNLNWTQWSVTDGKLALTGKSVADNHALNFNEAIAYANESRWSLNYAASSAGNWTMTGARDAGTYINYESMQGSGTKDDPYLISDALTLARVIGSGGKNYTEKLYFKLTNDINVGGWRWLTTDGYAIDGDGDGTLDAPKYAYVPFEGVLDGDGYAVTGLYVNDDSYAALIPQMTATGVVKNLHIRNSYAVGTNSAVITANAASGAVIEGCSVEDTAGVTTIADETATINNSYCGDTYYINDATGTPSLDGTVWYGIAGGKAYLVNRAKAMACADVNGDGIGVEYDTTDLTSLRNKILRKSAYANIYGDLNLDGKVNTGDLVILNREILAQSAADVKNEWVARDGFWRNLALGNFEIYYGENDNYDAARKLELYLESAVSGLDIKKNVNGTDVYVHSNDGTAAPGSRFAIVVGNVGSYTTALTGNNYGVTYDKDNAVLWIQGANFTGIEQAVLDFIAGSDAATGVVGTVETKELSTEKQPRTINGTTYYYAWGDEFDVATSDNSLTKDIWEYGEMGTETSEDAFSFTTTTNVGGKYNGTGNYKYHNLETAIPADFSSLYEVNNGKLTIWRGMDTDKYNTLMNDSDTTNNPDWGYKPVTLTDGTTTAWGAEIDSEDIYASAGAIDTQKSLLFKQGYVEMKATLPNDGHAFPAWWLLGAPDGGQNRTYDTSLFGKVYSLNNNWTGVNAMHGAYPNSYKYQIPTCHLEMDLVELMQDISYADENGGSFFTGEQRYSQTEGVDRTAFNLTVHKWYDENVDDDKLYVIDWDANGNGGTIKNTYDYSTFNSSTTGAWTHRWDGLEYDMSSLSNLAGEHIYGFAWTANETNNTFTVTVYVDGTAVMTFNQDQGYYLDQESATLETALNAEGGTVFNQYVYFILDNHFYTYNQYYIDGYSAWKTGTNDVTSGKAFTDLDTQETGDVAIFTIDYVRVYQEDGKRDIVTKETENFNNGNHFGYGK